MGFDPSIVSESLVRLLLVKLSRSVGSPLIGFVSGLINCNNLLNAFFDKTTARLEDYLRNSRTKTKFKD